jgi:hypothetical protein
MAVFLRDNPDAVGIHPALTNDSTTHWEHMKSRGGAEPRRTWFIDNICSLYRRTWWDDIGGFDARLTYGWGIDLETCLIARRQNKSLWIHEGCLVKKVTDIGYTMNRMRATSEQRRKNAAYNMARVLELKHGPNWDYIVRNEGALDEWK